MAAATPLTDWSKAGSGGRDLDDDALADTIKDCGLGTPATRAEIIERLIRSGYVRRERKSLKSTEKGRALIALGADPLRSPELTAAWEQQLKEVEAGRYAAAMAMARWRMAKSGCGAHSE